MQWDDMSIGEIDKLIEIMPQQIDQVIMRGGDFTEY